MRSPRSPDTTIAEIAAQLRLLNHSPSTCSASSLRAARELCDPVAFANLPANGFYAIGVAGQLIIVLPSADIAIARVARDDMGGEYWDGYARDATSMVLDAVVK